MLYCMNLCWIHEKLQLLIDVYEKLQPQISKQTWNSTFLLVRWMLQVKGLSFGLNKSLH